MPTIRLIDLRYHVVRTATRFPFRYGIAAMTAAPHLFLRAEFEVDGKQVTGFSAEGLPPKWFVKSPDTTFDADLPDMIETIRNAVKTAVEVGEQPSFYDWWRAVYQGQDAWASENGTPPLLAHLGTSLVERAGIDALCRALGQPFAQVLADNWLGLRLGEIHPELGDRGPAELIQQGQAADSTLLIRHTVGLADPLTDEEILEADRVDDGLPHSLEACVKAYGIRYFKIKLGGLADHDCERLRRIAGILNRLVPDFRYTLDGNEQFRDFGDFWGLWEQLQADPDLASFLSSEHLLFVEQPLHRDMALAKEVEGILACWPDAPPFIIDESDASLNSLRRALNLGYSGTSHKNCKGVIKGIANACLLAHLTATDTSRSWILSGEDLTNIGPVALLQDLTVMHALGIRHVERNGHHYFSGLGMMPSSVQSAVLANHGGLYRDHDGYPALAIRDGVIEIGSVLSAPFGTGFAMDDVIDDWRSLDEWENADAFRGY